MTDACEDLKDALDAAQDAYDEAWWDELSAELNQWGAAACTAGAGVGTAACFGVLTPASGGLATAGCYGAGVVTAGSAAWTASGWIAEDKAEKIREAAEKARDEAKGAYCDCLKENAPGGVDGGAPADAGADLPAGVDATDISDLVNELDAVCEEDPEECVCEEGDEADATENFSSSDAGEDAENMCTYELTCGP